jgi:small conductance mechanosensitive channel
MNFNLDAIAKQLIEYLPTLLLALVVLIVGLWIIKYILRIIDRNMQKRDMEESLRKFLSSLIGIFLKIMLILSVVSMFGVETTSFVAIFGALMIGVGMALNGTIGHFASGVMLMIFKPFKVGDLVTIGGGQTTGTVEAINAFNTTLLTLDNKRIFIANSHVTGNDITNISGQGHVGVELTYGIGYNDSIDAARKIILEVGKACPHILDNPAQGVVVGELADSSVNLNTRPFCNSEHYWSTYFYMQEHVKKEFDKAGIGIPYPQMDVHLRKVIES